MNFAEICRDMQDGHLQAISGGLLVFDSDICDTMRNAPEGAFH